MFYYAMHVFIVVHLHCVRVYIIIIMGVYLCVCKIVPLIATGSKPREIYVRLYVHQIRDKTVSFFAGCC